MFDVVSRPDIYIYIRINVGAFKDETERNLILIYKNKYFYLWCFNSHETKLKETTNLRYYRAERQQFGAMHLKEFTQTNHLHLQSNF